MVIYLHIIRQNSLLCNKIDLDELICKLYSSKLSSIFPEPLLETGTRGVPN